MKLIHKCMALRGYCKLQTLFAVVCTFVILSLGIYIYICSNEVVVKIPLRLTITNPLENYEEETLPRNLQKLTYDLEYGYNRPSHVLREKVRESLVLLYEIINDLRELKSSNANKQVDTNGEIDVCPEKFAFKELSGGYPFFYKGFEITKCPEAPPFHTLLTLVYNVVHYSDEDASRLTNVIKEVNKIYPGLQVIAGVTKQHGDAIKSLENVRVVYFDKSEADTDIWNKLVSEVKTKYVYIGRDVAHFSWFDRLERLVREINRLNAHFIGSATRELQSGKWTHGCEQIVLRNYTLVYREGYDVSKEECMMCSHTNGPFVTKTLFLKQSPLPSKYDSTSGFASWFLELSRSSKSGYVCPDSMSFVTKRSREPKGKNDWLLLAKKYSIERIVLANGQIFEFDCDEVRTESCVGFGIFSNKDPALALSHCCMRKLVAVKMFVLDVCKKYNLLCELQEGTLLGAVKFNHILPWELDGDITLHQDNFTAFKTIFEPECEKRGYRLGLEKGFYRVHASDGSGWYVEIFPQSDTDTARLSREGISGTLIYFNGQYVPAPTSPGLFVRNRYGKECYRHVQHWVHTGKKSSWSFYDAGQFAPCPKPDHHACLDQYIPDGNFQFADPIP